MMVRRGLRRLPMIPLLVACCGLVHAAAATAEGSAQEVHPTQPRSDLRSWEASLSAREAALRAVQGRIELDIAERADTHELAETLQIDLTSLARTFAAMRPTVAAQLLDDMPVATAAAIAAALSPRSRARVLTYMAPDDASAVTLCLADAAVRRSRDSGCDPHAASRGVTPAAADETESTGRQ